MKYPAQIDLDKQKYFFKTMSDLLTKQLELLEKLNIKFILPVKL